MRLLLMGTATLCFEGHAVYCADDNKEPDLAPAGRCSALSAAPSTPSPKFSYCVHHLVWVSVMSMLLHLGKSATWWQRHLFPSKHRHSPRM